VGLWPNSCPRRRERRLDQLHAERAPEISIRLVRRLYNYRVFAQSNCRRVDVLLDRDSYQGRMVRRRLIALRCARARRGDPLARRISAPPPAPGTNRTIAKKTIAGPPTARRGFTDKTADSPTKEGDGEPKAAANQMDKSFSRKMRASRGRRALRRSCSARARRGDPIAQRPVGPPPAPGTNRAIAKNTTAGQGPPTERPAARRAAACVIGSASSAP